MSHVFTTEEAHHYNDWLQSEPGRTALLLEKKLLERLWSPPSGQRVLEVGCGTGIFLDWFVGSGHQVTGLDPSAAMLQLARRHLPDRIELQQGYAEDLPYDDNAFDTVALITVLEFVDDPLRALREAARVARHQVIVGALNKYSLVAWERYLERFWKSSIYRHARFFSVFELHRLVDVALSGPVPLTWRTCLAFPLSALRYLHFLESSRYFQWHPFGHFIGMRIDLRYTVHTAQSPVLCELGTGISRTRLHGSALRSPCSSKSTGDTPESRLLAYIDGSVQREIGVSSSH